MNYNDKCVHEEEKETSTDPGNKYLQKQNYKERINDSKVDSKAAWYIFGTIPSHESSSSP